MSFRAELVSFIFDRPFLFESGLHLQAEFHRFVLPVADQADQPGKENSPSHQWAVDNTRSSFPCIPTICNPSGSPRGPNPTGIVMAGTPQRLQM
ncbi:MAG: hypothetical protein COS57_11700, partial [Syntrophobacterales bacterium CG03_land_8_20_14_0_80_58_14]